jgi:hypothetical protein
LLKSFNGIDLPWPLSGGSSSLRRRTVIVVLARQPGMTVCQCHQARHKAAPAGGAA